MEDVWPNDNAGAPLPKKTALKNKDMKVMGQRRSMKSSHEHTFYFGKKKKTEQLCLLTPLPGGLI